MRRKKMIQLGICDEDLKITQILCHMIETQYAGQIKVYTWKSAEEMLSWQKEYKTVLLDIIIIDLSMENGISFAEKLNALSRRLKIIFITEQLYAVSDIFRISPIYLLAKPVSVIKLVEAIEQAIEKIRWEEIYAWRLKGAGGEFAITYFGMIEKET